MNKKSISYSKISSVIIESNRPYWNDPCIFDEVIEKQYYDQVHIPDSFGGKEERCIVDDDGPCPELPEALEKLDREIIDSDRKKASGAKPRHAVAAA
ncbi:hypothetical protein ACFL43_00920 [Thermodesulfobacteriota bacterium]